MTAFFVPRLGLDERAEALDLLCFLLLDVVLLLGGGYLLAPQGSTFDEVGLASALYAPMLVCVLAAVVTALRPPQAFLSACVGFLAPLLVIDAIFMALQPWPRFVHGLDQIWPQNLALSAVVTWWLTAVLCCGLLGWARRWRKLLALIAPILVIGIPLTVVDRTASFWVPPAVDEAAAADTGGAAVPEALLYDEPSILNHALSGITRRTPGSPNVYFVGFAGNGEQAVFEREVNYVKEYFDSHFAGPGHTLALINSPLTEASVPLATVTALNESLKVIGARMNDDDVLVLFLTSHGSRESGVNVAFDPFEFDDLDPASLKQMLDDAHIRQRIIIVSACYAGVFIAPLANPNTLVITAADASHTSFGCSNEADFTYFGRAYFADGLVPTNSFTEAFARAVPEIEQRESETDYGHSHPQMSLGADIAKTLPKLNPKVSRAGDGPPPSLPQSLSSARGNS